MNISEIVKIIKSENSAGLQLSKRSGFLSSTWLLYKKGNFFYYFDINQKIEFIDIYKYSEEELIDKFKDAVFEIDLPIS